MKQQLGSRLRPLEPRPLRIGLLGCGTVGSEVARILRQGSEGSTSLDRVAVRDLDKPRPISLARDELTDSALAIVKDPDIDIVVELIGGIEPSFGLIRQALAEGKHVVTANKAVLGRHGSSLRRAAAERGVSLLYEGAAGAAIPIVRTLRTISSADRTTSLTAVLNGTTNHVLCEMERGATLSRALEAARDQGFAEADVSEDIDGVDAACKLAILASLAFGTDVPFESVSRCGIRDVTPEDVQGALARGLRMKLVAAATLHLEGSVSAFVAPVALAADHPLVRLEGVQNGVVLESECSGRLSLYGEGAGGRPTAAAVMADIEEITRASTQAARVAPTDYERKALE